MDKRYCYACGHEMIHKDIAVDARWGKYTVMITGMAAHACRNCTETVVDAGEILALHELEQRFSDLMITELRPIPDSSSQPLVQSGTSHCNGCAAGTVDECSGSAYAGNQICEPPARPTKNRGGNGAAKSDLLGVKEVAELLQIAPQSVYSLIYVEKLPAVKFGNAWRFKPEDVHAFMEANAT